MPRNYEEIISYPQSKAGERVGWVTVSEAETQVPVENPPFEFKIVSATVGENGARFGLTTLENPDRRKSLPIPYQEGFMGVVAVSGILPIGDYDPVYEHNFQYQSGPNKVTRSSRPEDLLLRGIGFFGANGSYQAKDQWATSNNDLVERIKTSLSDAELLERYPQVYYWLNGIVGRFTETGDTVLEDLELADLLLVDPKMAETTIKQEGLAADIVQNFEKSLLVDEEMINDLTVFGNIEASDIPRVFEERRKEVASLERSISDNLAGLAIRSLIYLPTGYRPSGRTWPYMDATETDKDKAYGIELRALEQGAINPAKRELEEETRELVKRQFFAEAGRKRLGNLATLERAH